VDRAELAACLAAADEAERAMLLKRYGALVDVDLARALKRLYDDTESSDPARAVGAAGALMAVADAIDDPEVRALAAWTSGMAKLDGGQMEEAIAYLNDAETQFLGLGRPHTAAATQVSKLIALAMLGRYDEAIACGLQARDVFLAHGDTLAAGKIEQNLGNIYYRRDRYREAEQFYRSARERFNALGEQKQLTFVDMNLANVLAVQHRLRDAAQLYEEVLARAGAAGLDVTQALIERNLGCFALDHARYDQALDWLERSRRHYTALDMHHHVASIELELADTYLELNLAPEAAAIYTRIIPTFAELGMRAEQARASANHGRACLLLGQIDEAHALLSEARALYAAEGNVVGEALVMLIEAQIHYAEGNYAATAELAAQAEHPLAEASIWGQLLLARWLHGHALGALGQQHAAQRLLESTLHDAERWVVPLVAQRCHTALGVLAASIGHSERAEAAFKRAVELIEALRSPLPAEEFRTAFVADKLKPYAELARLCLSDQRGTRFVESLGYVERARARALADILGGELQLRSKAHDRFEAELLARLKELQEELNWFYSQINRPRDGDFSRSDAVMEELHQAVRKRETTILEITRQLQHRSVGPQHTTPMRHAAPLDISQLQQDLGTATALVEYFSLDGVLLAFVVTTEGVEVVRDLGHEEQVEAALKRFHVQIGSLRRGTGWVEAYLDRLTSRTRHHLAELYDLLLRPIEERLGARRLVVVPHRTLHYVPFHALHDGAGYVIERREVCYAPSASVLRYCLARPRRPLRSAALFGFPDTQVPRVRDEVSALAPLFPRAATLLDDQATLAALHAQAPAADVLHLACHGQFRPDNPLFSSLRLADGWLTVRDAYALDLNCQLVVLSACETGVSKIAPGDELIGLARGFFSAGAPTLLVSLWTVDDESTARLMASFYARLRDGENPAAALRHAQCELLAHHPHPFFWCPFVLLGRW
jgi:tetratricopeptide (TPR) repeat protein